MAIIGNTETHPVISGGNFAIISGEEPHHVPEIQGGHRGLEQLLNQNGFKYEATDANHGHQNHAPTFIIHNIPRGQAMDIGRKLGQDSIIFSSNGQHEFIYTNGPNAGKYHPAMGSHSIHPYPPEGQTSTRIPNVGHIQFSFDHGKLLDVPKKGSAMSQDTKKGEVSVVDFKKALAKSLRNQINSFSKSLEELAKREVAQNIDASVGDLKLGPGNSFEFPEESLLAKSVQAMATAAAMKRVYDSYKSNVAIPQFPNDPQRQHELAAAAARDWASRTNNFNDILHMATGEMEKAEYEDDDHNECKCGRSKPKSERMCSQCASIDADHWRDSRRDRKIDMEKSIRKETGPGGAKLDPDLEAKRKANAERRARDEAADEAKRQEFKAKGHDITIKSDADTWRKELGKSDTWLEKIGDPEVEAGAAKSEMFIDDKNSGARPATTDAAKKGGPRVKDVGYETEVPASTKPVAGKLDEGSGGQVTKGKKLGKAAIGADASAGEGTGVGASGIGNLSSSEKCPSCGEAPGPEHKKSEGCPYTKKAEMLSKPPKSEAQRRAMGAAASGHSTLGIPKSVGKEFIDADKGGKLPARKAELVPNSDSGTSRETGSALTDGPGKGSGAGKMPVTKGKDGEGVGSVLTDNKGKGKGPGGNKAPVEKAELVPNSNSGTARNVGDALTDGPKGKGSVGKLLTEKGKDGEGVGSVMKAAPPMAKPPSGKAPTPAAPPQSKPMASKMPKFGKEEIPGVTRPGIAGAGAGKPMTPATPGHYAAPPPPLPKPAVKPMGAASLPPVGPKPGGSGLQLDTRAAAHAFKGRPGAAFDIMKRSEEEIDLLGKCALCGKAEHLGSC